MNIKRRYFALAGAAAAAIGLTLGAAGAASATSAVCAAAAPTCVSFATPIHGGLDLDAQNWGINPQTGTSYNDQITVWGRTVSGRAADFTKVAVPTADLPTAPAFTTPAGTANAGPFLIEFDPKGVPSGFCVSTILNGTPGTYVRLRPCWTEPSTPVAGDYNQWQTFYQFNQGDGFFQLCTINPAGTKTCLNVKGWGGNATPVIAWPSTGSAQNQIWEQHG